MRSRTLTLGAQDNSPTRSVARRLRYHVDPGPAVANREEGDNMFYRDDVAHNVPSYLTTAKVDVRTGRKDGLTHDLSTVLLS